MDRILYVDMDNVLVNFQSGIDRLSPELIKKYKGDLDEVPGIFSLMDPLEAAIDSYQNFPRILIPIFFLPPLGKIQLPLLTNLLGLNTT
jgi:hypothetical protein